MLLALLQPLTAALLLAAAPLDCPPGTTLKGAAPPEDLEAWCEGRPDASGKPRRHGPARTWYDDGGLRTESRWSEGRRDGPFVEYHRNGRKAREGTYLQDDRVGTWTIWYEDGGLEERGEYLRNVPHGPATTWHRGGQKRSQGRFCMGAQCGTWVSYDERGREVGRAEFGEQRTAP
jgi:antitoxin component YwqK of YwqJK toxin-antitoxin module